MEKIFGNSESMAKTFLFDLIEMFKNSDTEEIFRCGLADEILEYGIKYSIIKELKTQNCPEIGIEIMSRFLDILSNEDIIRICDVCEGAGYFLEFKGRDRWEYDEKTICENCNGDGYTEEESWAVATAPDSAYSLENWVNSQDLTDLYNWQ